MFYFLSLFVIAISVIIILIVLSKDKRIEQFKTYITIVGSSFIIILFGVFFIIDTAEIIKIYSEADATVKTYQQKYDNIIYQLESDMYKENNIGLRDLMVEVESWNENVIEKKELVNDFWFGIYYPDVYEQFEPINLSEYDLN